MEREREALRDEVNGASDDGWCCAVQQKLLPHEATLGQRVMCKVKIISMGQRGAARGYKRVPIKKLRWTRRAGEVN